MGSIPFFSICIPAYKNADFVYRLLTSIVNQTCSDYEIIVSDDSPDDSVEKLVNEFSQGYNIKYFKNNPPAGTPANWNFAISKASGKWIKLMHDDDWLSSNNTLLIFKKNTEKHSSYNFFYSLYNNINEKEEFKHIKNSLLDIMLLRLSILNIFRKNTIGNPSCVLVKNTGLLYYDENLKWLVDIDYYITYVSKYKKIKYIPEALVNVGINAQQVTKMVFRNPAVELPENFYVLEKHGIKILKNIIIYDHYWRLIRNLNIKNKDDVTPFYSTSLPPQIHKIIAAQSHYNNRILNIRLLSKILMVIQFIKFRLGYL